MPSRDVSAVAWCAVNQFNAGLLILRVVFGLFLAYHGYNKFFGPGGLAGTARWFGSIGMRWPTWQARLAATTEIGAGVLMAAGLLTPLAAAGMIGVMIVAIVVAHWKVGFFIFKPEPGLGVLRIDRRHRLRRSPWSGPGDGRSTTRSTSTGTAGPAPSIAAVAGVGGAVTQLAVCYRKKDE